MKRITPDDVRAAMEKLGDGYELADGSFALRIGDTICVCAIGALAIADGESKINTKDNRAQATRIRRRVAKSLGVSHVYIQSFIDGFDGYPYRPSSPVRRMAHDDGRCCREELLS